MKKIKMITAVLLCGLSVSSCSIVDTSREPIGTVDISAEQLKINSEKTFNDLMEAMKHSDVQKYYAEVMEREKDHSQSSSLEISQSAFNAWKILDPFIQVDGTDRDVINFDIVFKKIAEIAYGGKNIQDLLYLDETKARDEIDNRKVSFSINDQFMKRDFDYYTTTGFVLEADKDDSLTDLYQSVFSFRPDGKEIVIGRNVDNGVSMESDTSELDDELRSVLVALQGSNTKEEEVNNSKLDSLLIGKGFILPDTTYDVVIENGFYEIEVRNHQIAPSVVASYNSKEQLSEVRPEKNISDTEDQFEFLSMVTPDDYKSSKDDPESSKFHNNTKLSDDGTGVIMEINNEDHEVKFATPSR